MSSRRNAAQGGGLKPTLIDKVALALIHRAGGIIRINPKDGHGYLWAPPANRYRLSGYRGWCTSA